MEIRNLTLISVIAALYAALVIVLAPISFGPIQLRIADCLIPLAALLGWPAIFGVALGALIGNSYYFLGFIDVIFGSLANLVAGVIIYRFRDRLLPACLTGALTIGLIVGGYLPLYFPPPDVGVLVLPVWLAWMVNIALSSIIAVSILGYLLVKALKATGLFDLLL